VIDKLIDVSLRNRFLLIAFYILVILWGIWSVKNTPIDAIPDLSENQVIVFTDWSGRSPQEVEDQITYPLTVNLQGLAGVKAVRSASAFGFSMITVIFEDRIDLYFARTRVAERLSLASSFLPEGVVPTLGPDATGLGQIFWYTLESKNHSLEELRTLQDWFVRYQLNSVPGVAEIGSIGGFVKQYQIDVDPNKLRAYNVDLKMVFEAVMMSNSNVGGKVIEKNGMEFILRGIGLIQSVEDVKNIVVDSRNGVPVYVKNVAIVQLGPEFRRGALDKDGKEVVGGVVVMRYGENTMDVINRVKQKIEEIKPALPQGVKVIPFYDRTDLIKATEHTLKRALIEESILVFLVILIFLGHFLSTFIVITSLPIGVLIAFIFMRYLGITSNIMSLGGIAIAIGVMVDAGIVIVENSFRHLEKLDDKTKKLETVALAAKEVGRPIFFSMVIIILAFVPVFSLQGQEGKLFHPLAFTKTLAMIGASILAITWVPVLSTYLLRGKLRSEEKHPLNRFLMKLYEPVLLFALKHKKIVIGSALIILVGAFLLIPLIGSEFMPPLEEGKILYMPTLLPAVSLTQAMEIVKKQDMILEGFPEVESVVGKVGRAETATDPAPISMIETVVNLKPKEKWRKGMTKDKLIKEMDEKLSVIPGVAGAFTQPIRNRIDMLTTGVRTQVGIKIFGSDLKVLEEKSQEIERVVRMVPGATDIYAERVIASPYLEIKIDRNEVARYGIKLGDVMDVVETAIGGKNLTTTIEGRARFPVRVRYARELRDNINALKNILVSAPNGAQIPLSQLSEISINMGPYMISSENGLLRNIVQLNVRGRDLVGFVEEAKRLVQKEVKLPAGYFVSWSGQYENQVRAKERLKIVVPLVLFIILMLLYIIYRSFKEALLIIASIPFAMVGGILLLFILGYNFSVAVWVGFIALFGTAVETGVVMVVYLDEAIKKRGLSNIKDKSEIREAVIEGALLRLRPKLMTVGAIILGLLPVMWTKEAGSEVMKPIATPVIGGMITSTLLVLIVIPVIYEWMKEREWRKTNKL